MTTSIFPLAFMAILFLQSGSDKALNYQGNKAYLTDYFKNSILAKWVVLLMPVITLLEVAAGLFCTVGLFGLLCQCNIELSRSIAQIGMVLSASSILCLFFGQRIAKDYAASVSMTSYFIVALLGLYFMGS